MPSWRRQGRRVRTLRLARRAIRVAGDDAIDGLRDDLVGELRKDHRIRALGRREVAQQVVAVATLLQPRDLAAGRPPRARRAASASAPRDLVLHVSLSALAARGAANFGVNLIRTLPSSAAAAAAARARAPARARRRAWRRRRRRRQPPRRLGGGTSSAVPAVAALPSPSWLCGQLRSRVGVGGGRGGGGHRLGLPRRRRRCRALLRPQTGGRGLRRLLVGLELLEALAAGAIGVHLLART